MSSRYQRVLSALIVIAIVGVLAGCAHKQTPSQTHTSINTTNQDADTNLAAFSTTLRGSSQIPLVATKGEGRVDAVLNIGTRLLRWKVSWKEMTGVATGAAFHGPASKNSQAGISLNWKNPITAPYEGQAVLTTKQAEDLLAGKWYANIRTTVHPKGEIRGQLILRN